MISEILKIALEEVDLQPVSNFSEFISGHRVFVLNVGSSRLHNITLCSHDQHKYPIKMWLPCAKARKH